MRSGDVVKWHSKIALDFDSKYGDRIDFIERNAAWMKAIHKYSSSAHLALDVGCGSGVFSFLLAEKNRRVLAIDASWEMLRLSKKKQQSGQVDFVQCDFYSLNNMLKQKVDLIICSSVLEYLENIDRSFETLSRLLCQGGTLIFSVPNKASIYRFFEPFLYKITGRPQYYQFVKTIVSMNAITDSLKLQGLQILEHEYFAPAPIVSKVLRFMGLSKYVDKLVLIVAQKV